MHRCFSATTTRSAASSRAAALAAYAASGLLMMGMGGARAQEVQPDDAESPGEKTSTGLLSADSLSLGHAPIRWLPAQGSGLAAPRVTRFDLDASPRENAALASSRPGARAELSGVSYRWWMPFGAANVGVGLGALGYVVRPFGDAGGGPSRFSGSVPMWSLGLRYPMSERSAVFADASGASGLRADGGSAYFTKVGVEWKSAPSPWRLIHSGLGFQLDNGSRMSLRVRGGKVAVYMRSEF